MEIRDRLCLMFYSILVSILFNLIGVCLIAEERVASLKEDS